MASVCFGIGILPKQGNKTYAVSTKVELGQDKKEFSALFDGDAVFSVEKVHVNSEEVDGLPYALSTVSGEKFETFYGENVSYSFKDITEGISSKQVVDNGEFVKLNNYYENGIYKNNKNIKHGSTNLQEAVMVSFGVYVYDKTNNIINVADQAKTIYAGLSYLNVSLEKDGAKQVLPDIRNINVEAVENGGLYFDFAYLITQQDDNSNEGYYKFKLNYMINFVEYDAEFEFYMINHSSYSYIETYEGSQYYAYPTLGWNETGSAGFSKSEDSTGYARYYIGKSGVGQTVSYPTITYDYTKFKLKYTHTANQRNSVYDINYEVAHQTANLTYSVTTSGKTTEMPSVELLDYDKSYKSNLVAIMLTEPGTYNVEFEYIYSGYNAPNAPKVNIGTEQINLAIHGLSAKYSKHNYASAQMEYFELASATNNHIDLFVPNGYSVNENINHLKNDKVGFVYSMVKGDAREGDILKANSIDSLINSSLKDVNNVSGDGVTTENNDYMFLTNNITNIKDYGLVGNITGIESKLSNILIDDTGKSKIKYAQTNQGSIWLDGNDQFSSNSFYFYSATPITVDAIKENVNTNGTETTNDDSYGLPYTNTTSFNKKGYYLVFVEVLPSGTRIEDTKYWQVFAFRYSSSSVDIVLETIDGDPVGSGKYTNKNVEISWKKPGIFDRDVTGYYYSVKELNYTKEELLKTQEKPLTITEKDGYLYANLGEDVEKGSFVKYLIKLKSEGETATYKTFTIDRQDISGVKAYLVKQMYSGSTSYYTYATDVSNNKIVVQYSITDSLATISWNNKASNAKIYASYSYTPFIITAPSASSITLNKGQTAITTNYELGTTIVGSEFKREDNPYVINSDSILFNQGIYIMKIWDEAGNYTNYSFVIDKTENWFKLNNEFASNTSKMYGDNVDYAVGDFKAFELKIDATTNDDVKNFITLASNGNLTEFDHYYQGSNNNVNVISNLFQKVGEKYYFAVPNEKVKAYKNDDIDTNIRTLSGKLQFVKEELDGAGYYKRKLYVVSRNQINSTSVEADYSYVIVSINKDNSLGLAYYGSTDNFSIPENGETSDDAKELMYGSDGFDAQGNATNGLKGAYATSAKYVAFVWNMGTGNFEVEKLSYTFYTLKPSDYNNDKYYFYGSGQDYEVYSNGTFSNGGQQLSDGTGRAVIRFNVGNESKAGLYVVTRTYKDLGADLGDDDLVKNYYFIVDRNKIIDLRQGIGSYIELELMESEPGFNDFSVENTATGSFSIEEDKIYSQYYNIYLSTTKLPATLVVPTGKYFDGTHTSADYYAGGVKVSVYFNDVDKQLPQTFKGFVHKIFDSNNATSKNGYFNIDIYKYLTNVNVALRDRLTVGDINGNWLFLSGEYIIRIQDKVIDETGSYHTTYIGFKITGADDEGPQVDTGTGFTKENTISIDVNKDENFTYSATISQEYLEVIIPKYNEDEMEKAQVDPNYLIVKQFYNNDKVGINYVNHPYSFKNGVVDITKASSNVVFNDDGSIKVFLDTKLRVDPNDPTSEINVKNLTKPLYYTITVRYKLTNGEGGNEKYKDCYIYHDATCHDENCEGIKYYEATYTIKIDREAPSDNINGLTDSLVNDYIKMYETDAMFENGVHQTSSWLYFTKQYAKYYQEDKTNKGYIYVYQVKAHEEDAEGNIIKQGTPFNSNDVERVYYNKIAGGDNLSELSTYNLNLPMIDESKYEGYLDGGFEYYSALSLTPNSYYEIIEVDKAGNTTQYVIHYEPATAEITIPVMVRRTTETESSEANFTFETSNAPINIFNISSNGETIVANDHFFKIELNKVDGTNVYTILTDVTTDFASITNNIVEEMNSTGSASYILKLTSRTIVNSININLIDASKINIKRTEDLVEESNAKYYINFNNINKYYEELSLWYFATDITIKHIDGAGNIVTDNYLGRIDAALNKVVYENAETGEKVDYPIECLPETTYQIFMSDILGPRDPYRFNTSGRKFYEITFEEPGEFYQDFDEIYYGYTKATIKFDKAIYENYKIYLKNKNGVYQESSSLVVDTSSHSVYNILQIDPIYDEATGIGGLIEVKVDLYYEEEENPDKTYYVTIDTRLATVALRDYGSGEFKDIIKIFNNVSFDDESTRATKTGAGIMNLHWEQMEENNYFNYTYTLHELMQNDVYRSFDLTNVNNYVINTTSESKGIYKFEIKVYGKDGDYIGNRLYSFEVQEVSTQLYYVRNSNGEAVNANSNFKPSEFANLTETIRAKFPEININSNIPLYVTNDNLVVVLTADSNVTISPAEKIASSGDYEFVMYKISKVDAYDIYLGILKLKGTNELVKDVMVGTEKVTGTTTFTIVGKPSDTVTITATRKSIGDASMATLLNKNKLLVDVYFNSELVGTKDFNDKLEILGNGQYSYVFKDMAGNIHEYDNDADKNNPETLDMLDVYVLREVVVLMNGEAPIANAFYNDAVELTVYRSTSFVTGSIKIEESKRNGENYLPKGHNSVYLFEDYGTYRVVISAKYLDPVSKEEIPLRKVLLFTILNVKEARNSIDLTSLSGYNITKVVNQKDEDVTSAFMEMINKNANIGGMLVTYEKVMEYAHRLNVSSGKTSFTITYVVEDESYPTREVNLSFTLNNEKPKIDCSLEKGDSTTKKFDITFNPAIIYEQVGESYIYINNRLVAHIDETSENKEVKVTTSYKNHGDGDYYIKLISSSGTILDSYKVTIKEPLNAGAVIIIIVVVAVVGTVVTTIIVLRRKMRIR